MARVTGIGGVFLRSPNPKRLAHWYAVHLGVKMSEHGTVNFLWKDEIPAGTGLTVWSAFPHDTEYFGSTQGALQQAMINYRVDDLDKLLEQLAGAGVWIDPKRETYDYGRFAWIKDCDGNGLELWQPLPLSDDQKTALLS